MTRAGKLFLVAAALLGLIAMAAGCGIPTEATARPDGPQRPTPVARGDHDHHGAVGRGRPAAVKLFLVSSEGDSEKLASIDADILNVVDLADLPRQVIEQLIAQAPKNSIGGSNLTNAIPPNAQVLNATVDGDVLDLDLSALDQVESTRQRLAVAQIVFTATNLDGIRRRAVLDRRRAGVGLARGPRLRRRPGDHPGDYPSLVAPS